MTAPFTRTWPTEDMALLEQGIAAGTPWEELARQLGRSVNAVKIRQRLFFPRPLDPAVNYGWGRGRPGRQAYWTLARVQDGLRDFASKHKGPLPTSDHGYNDLKKGHMEWPTAQRVLALFGTMADAWTAIGQPRSRVSRQWVPWTQEDDDYLLEHAGEQTLKIIGKHLGRSWGACKRRLYDLKAGRARDVSGYLSAAQVAQEYNCPVKRVQDLIARKELRAFKVSGGHYWRIDPADLPAVEAKLRAPKRTQKSRPTDTGAWRKANGIRRIRFPDGKVRQVSLSREQATRDQLAKAMRVAVRLMEDEGLVVDLGVAS